MQSELRRWAAETAPQIEKAIEQHLPVADVPGARALNECVRFAVFSGGKRMRPVLALASANLVGGDPEVALRVGAAMEYLHTASLILDDLPSMDNSGQRRGRPSSHIQHGEGVALLAAMALLNQTYALLAECENGAELVRLACECIGHHGMVAGQTIDLVQTPGERVGARQDHYLKTTTLFRLAMLAPAMAASCNDSAASALGEFGRCAGMAYQLIDDAHDLEADTQREGDWDGVTPARLKEQAARWVRKAKSELRRGFGAHETVSRLEEFADWLLAGAQTAKATG